MRKRQAGVPDVPPPPTRGPEGTQLAALLRARRFRLGVATERIARNLKAHGGEIANDAAACLTAARPPEDAPSVALGAHPGTLGPHSFGFLNNMGGVAPLDAPLPSLPRKGALALVVPRREALPDLGPLALARGLGISWIVSVGDGDPAEVLAFLGADAATNALAVVLGDGARGATLRSVLGCKPTVLLGGDALCRAVARRAGAQVVDGLDEWLARAALLDAGVEPGAQVGVIVVGGGRAWVAGEVAKAGLSAEPVAVDEGEPAALAEAVHREAAGDRAVVLVAGGPPELPEPADGARPRLLQADLRHPEHLRALLGALAQPAEAPLDEEQPRGAVDEALLGRVRAEVDRELGDHDAKRLLKAYGARVTRQAPTNTPTGALKIAKTIGVPVVLALPGDAPAEDKLAHTLPDVRRLSALMLQQLAEAPEPAGLQPGADPFVMVREHFPEVPRVRVRVQPEKGLGLVVRLEEPVEARRARAADAARDAPRDTVALLPLTAKDARELAEATPARRAPDQRAIAELLLAISACAVGEDALLDLELFAGPEPVVVRAKASLRKAPPPAARPAT